MRLCLFTESHATSIIERYLQLFEANILKREEVFPPKVKRKVGRPPKEEGKPATNMIISAVLQEHILKHTVNIVLSCKSHETLCYYLLTTSSDLYLYNSNTKSQNPR